MLVIFSCTGFYSCLGSRGTEYDMEKQDRTLQSRI